MLNNNILGGVSPIKARQSSRGGKAAGRATATSSRRGGFAKSSGSRGAGGRNVGGYNVQTKFKAGDDGLYGPVRRGPVTRIGDKPKSKSAPNPKPVVKEGNTIINNYTTNNTADAHANANANVNINGHYEYKDIYKDVVTKTEKERSSYQDSYDALEDKDGGKYNSRNNKIYKNFEDYEKDAKQFNKDNPDYKEYDTKTDKVYSHTLKKWIPGNSSNASVSANATANVSTDKDKKEAPGKMKLGGYRAMHGTSK